MLNRTDDEIKSAVNGLLIARQSKEVQAWIKEIEIYQERIVASAVNATGEEAVRYWGMMKGIGLCLNIDQVLLSESNIPSRQSKTLVRP